MTLGLAERQGRLGNVAVQWCEAELPERSIHGCTPSGTGCFPMSCSPTCTCTMAAGRCRRRSWRR
jgi:hypothetical protein